MCNKKRGSLILCDSCDKCFHFKCHKPKPDLVDPDVDKWYCARCTETISRKRGLHLRRGDLCWAKNAKGTHFPGVVLELDVAQEDSFVKVRFLDSERTEAWHNVKTVRGWHDFYPTKPSSALKTAIAEAESAAKALGLDLIRTPDRASTDKKAAKRTPLSGPKQPMKKAKVLASTPPKEVKTGTRYNQELNKIQQLLNEAAMRQQRLLSLSSSH